VERERRGADNPQLVERERRDDFTFWRIRREFICRLLRLGVSCFVLCSGRLQFLFLLFLSAPFLLLGHLQPVQRIIGMFDEGRFPNILHRL